jgi:hypothetical protein
MAKGNRSTAIGADLPLWLIAVKHASRHVWITLGDPDIRRAVCIHVDELLTRKHWLERMPAEHVRQVKAFASHSLTLTR